MVSAAVRRLVNQQENCVRKAVAKLVGTEVIDEVTDEVIDEVTDEVIDVVTDAANDVVTDAANDGSTVVAESSSWRLLCDNVWTVRWRLLPSCCKTVALSQISQLLHQSQQLL